jgi:YggT family protein
MSVLSTYAAFVAGVRVVLLYLAIALAIVCAVDWAVRTRRISPFSRVARFFRARIDPLMEPVERVILRAGGTPTSAAWWTLVGLILFGILVITLLQFLGGILTQVVMGISEPRSIPLLLVSWAFSLLRLALLVRVISSWLPISPYSRWIRWSYVLTEWMIAPLRRIIPLIGMIDITPIVAWFLLNIVQSALGIP